MLLIPAHIVECSFWCCIFDLAKLGVNLVLKLVFELAVVHGFFDTIIKGRDIPT